jgi:PST family polysaccharide transporter
MMTRESRSVPPQLGKRAATGAIILVASRLTTRAIDFLALVVLGRLLSPAEFGLVSIAMSVMMVVEAVMELPVFFALVAVKDRTRAHYDTAFTLLLIKGALLALTLLAIAWPLALIYHDDRLKLLIVVLGLAPASRGLGSPRMIDYSMNLNYRPNFVIEVAAKTVALVCSVATAWYTHSYWALAIGTLAFPITGALLSYLYAPYIPRLTISKWRDFSTYLGWTTLTQIVSALNWQFDQLVLARFVDRFELGRFSMSANLATIPWQVFIVQIISPLLIAFSLVRHDADRLRAAYKKSTLTIIAIGLPIMVGMSLAADLIIELVLGDQWLDAAHMLRWLSLATIPSMFVAPLSPLTTTLNKAHVLFWLALIEALIKLPTTIIAVRLYGIEGVLFVRAMLSAAMALSSMLAVRGLIQLPVVEQLFAPWRPMLSVALMVAAAAPLKVLLGKPDHFAQIALVLGLIGTLSALVYGLSIFVLWRLAGSPEGFEAGVFKSIGSYWQRVSSFA